MAESSQMIASVLFLLSITTIGCTVIKDEAAADLEAAEANGKLEIIKQIKKVNDDGSYTIGYEADDGSFKIESRDVLGNIKGTYGYIDDNGQIKRVTYSSSNNTEVLPSTNEPPSVVQRIPSKLNRTSPTTRQPVYTSSTQSTPTTTPTVVAQAISRRRVITSTVTPSTSTEKYSQFIKDAYAASQSSTIKPTTILYETSTPARILAQSKPLVRSTALPQSAAQKSEGQLLRPEITLKPTDLPLYRRLPIKTTLLDDETKPVTEEPEVRGNLLRRQLPQEKSFDARQHVLNVQQAVGEDNVDVFSGSVTTGSPRPLFTTLRPRVISSAIPPLIHRPTPTLRYHPVYQQPIPKAVVTTEFPQGSSTEPSITPSPVPVVQIPANPEEPQRQQFVELRHPFHRGAILVPVNSLQGRSVPQQQQQQQQSQPQNIEYQQVLIPPEQQQQLYLRRVPKFRPIPVHVDENGYIREFHPAPTQIPIQHRPQYVTQTDIINEVDQIKPPVSTKDFQKLLEQLIVRQSRLEKISSLTHQTEMFRQRALYHEPQQHVYPNQLQFVPRTQTAQPQQQHPVIVRPQDEQYNQYSPVTFTPPPNYHPTKRMARLQQHDEDEYLPAPVREMLLLRMLQLAINPSLPLEVSDNMESATTPHPRKDAVRNVEILGEEEDHKRPSRTKRTINTPDYEGALRKRRANWSRPVGPSEAEKM